MVFHCLFLCLLERTNIKATLTEEIDYSYPDAALVIGTILMEQWMRYTAELAIKCSLSSTPHRGAMNELAEQGSKAGDVGIDLALRVDGKRPGGANSARDPLLLK